MRTSPELPAPFAAVIVLLLALAAPAQAQVRRVAFHAPGKYLVVEALDDDLLHFEYGRGQGPGESAPLGTSPMIYRTDYAGPTRFSASASGVETPEIRVAVQPSTLCFTATDLTRQAELTTVCPWGLDQAEKGLTFTRGRTRNVYGLGEQFTTLGESDGDWMGRERTPGDEYGNKMVGYAGGAVGNAMFPIMYAVGDRHFDYALFLDQVYAQGWDFRADPFRVTTRGDQLRGYLMTGPDLPDLRRDYLELVGRPPVPPRKAFGLWVSEYGFDNWAELEGKLKTLREHHFPIDGFVMDVQWFGGLHGGSDTTSMGRLAWDETNFPHPAQKIAELERQGIGIIPIEESYIGRARPEFDTLQALGYMARQSENGPATYLTTNPWWGKGGMIDWTNPTGAAFWHDWKRQPLIDMGIVGHWTDLGEPEIFDTTSWFHGVEPGKHTLADIHNLYNLEWARSIYEGYRRHDVERRPFILSRSGVSGIERFGAAMWSGDIGANMGSLATQMNARMQMSMSGIDYFGSDVGGFHREALAPGESEDSLYTQWFANAALLAVPVRAHTENLCNCKETAPDRVGDLPSNRANLRLRYALAPYYYSLAHLAYRDADPLVAPLFFYYQDDPNVRTMGGEKLVGRELLVADVTRYGATKRDVYLPRGRWIDFYTGESHTSAGEWLRSIPVRRQGLFRLPLFVRAGAILPEMYVDEKTMNIFGQRTDGTVRDELIARVYPDARPSRFTLYEDDGRTIAYQRGAVATTVLSQQGGDAGVVVTVGARQGDYDGAPDRRDNVVELVTRQPVAAVTLDGRPLRRYDTREELDHAQSGWLRSRDSVVIARSGTLPVGQEKRFEFRRRR
ncbi:MAG TPA: TIM-barrel domain-containing protein [Longimicrobiaceae bacterium]|nr:TIM-barrel domain-containing protein [Longimicrobiaceae bacterium]